LIQGQPTQTYWLILLFYLYLLLWLFNYYIVLGNYISLVLCKYDIISTLMA
jgi:hypothetical protein